MTSGGSSDTELNELAVKPTKPCVAGAVMIVTPVANCAMASRNCRSAMAGRLRSWVGIVAHRAAGRGGQVPPHLRGQGGDVSKRGGTSNRTDMLGTRGLLKSEVPHFRT